jgi:hypothetical protein
MKGVAARHCVAAILVRRPGEFLYALLVSAAQA